MKKIVVNLNHNSIQNAIKEIKQYEDSLDRKCEILAQRLSELGVSIAKTNVAAYDAIFTRELYQSIHNEKVGSNIFLVIADSTHAKFVEFGTGIIGKKNSYPYPFPDDVDWEYASGKTIRHLANGKYGWFYLLDGKWHFTEGMPARPFMFETSLELQKKIYEIAKEVFG